MLAVVAAAVAAAVVSFWRSLQSLGRLSRVVGSLWASWARDFAVMLTRLEPPPSIIEKLRLGLSAACGGGDVIGVLYTHQSHLTGQ